MDTDKLKFELLKSFLNWCYESDLRPFIIVKQFKDFPLDESYFVNDVITLRLGKNDILNYKLEDNKLSFSCSFNKVPYNIVIPVEYILAAYPVEQPSLQLILYHIVKEETERKDTDKVLKDKTSSKNKVKPGLRVIK